MIVLFSKENSKLKGDLLKFLRVYGFGAVDKKIALNSKFGRDIVVCADRRKNISADNAVLVFAGCDDIGKFKIEGNAAFAVTYGMNINSAKKLLEMKLNVVNCGLANTDTVTISSMNYENILISLQRKIKNIYGKFSEPQEYSLNHMVQFSPEVLLIGVAILIIYGISP